MNGEAHWLTPLVVLTGGIGMFLLAIWTARVGERRGRKRAGKILP